jgi:hypothetical protein
MIIQIWKLSKRPSHFLLKVNVDIETWNQFSLTQPHFGSKSHYKLWLHLLVFCLLIIVVLFFVVCLLITPPSHYVMNLYKMLLVHLLVSLILLLSTTSRTRFKLSLYFYPQFVYIWTSRTRFFFFVVKHEQNTIKSFILMGVWWYFNCYSCFKWFNCSTFIDMISYSSNLLLFNLTLNVCLQLLHSMMVICQVISLCCHRIWCIICEIEKN